MPAARKRLTPGKARDRINPMRVFVNAEERARIEANASSAGMSVSAFLRAAATGVRVPSVRDRATMDALIKVNADQSRLGNLMKLYLDQDRAPDRDRALRLLDEIRDTQAALRNAVRAIAA
jgi:hypothetical protein